METNGSSNQIINTVFQFFQSFFSPKKQPTTPEPSLPRDSYLSDEDWSDWEQLPPFDTPSSDAQQDQRNLSQVPDEPEPLAENQAEDPLPEENLAPVPPHNVNNPDLYEADDEEEPHNPPVVNHQNAEDEDEGFSGEMEMGILPVPPLSNEQIANTLSFWDVFKYAVDNNNIVPLGIQLNRNPDLVNEIPNSQHPVVTSNLYLFPTKPLARAYEYDEMDIFTLILEYTTELDSKVNLDKKYALPPFLHIIKYRNRVRNDSPPNKIPYLKKLIDKNPDVLRQKHRTSALVLAYRQQDPEMFEFLLDYPSLLEHPSTLSDIVRSTPCKPLKPFTLTYKINCLTKLIEKYPQVLDQEKTNLTPLTHAHTQQDIDVFNFLLNYPVFLQDECTLPHILEKIYKLNNNQAIDLQLKFMKNLLKTFPALTKENAKINPWHPLCLSLKTGNTDAIELILTYGEALLDLKKITTALERSQDSFNYVNSARAPREVLTIATYIPIIVRCHLRKWVVEKFKIACQAVKGVGKRISFLQNLPDTELPAYYADRGILFLSKLIPNQKDKYIVVANPEISQDPVLSDEISKMLHRPYLTKLLTESDSYQKTSAHSLTIVDNVM